MAQDAERFEIMLSSSTLPGRMWEAVYDRTISPGVGWVGGDRVGYGCAYMFLLKAGRPVARVTFQRVPGADYAAVNDKYMEEGARYYNGGVATGGLQQLNDCPESSEEYEPYDGPDQRPVITFVQKRGGVILETRDYRNTVAADGVTFQLTSSSADKATVVGYAHSQAAIVVYYQRILPTVVVRSTLK